MRAVVLVNSGLINYDFVWDMGINPRVAIKPEKGTVPKGERLVCELAYHPHAPDKMRDYKVSCQIINGAGCGQTKEEEAGCLSLDINGGGDACSTVILAWCLCFHCSRGSQQLHSLGGLSSLTLLSLPYKLSYTPPPHQETSMACLSAEWGTSHGWTSASRR